MSLPGRNVEDRHAAVNFAELYQPQPKQQLFHASAAPYRAMIGGAGSGKSIGLLWEALTYCFTFPGIQCLLLRRNFPELEKGLIADLRATFPQSAYHWDDQDHIASFPMGASSAPSKIFFGHCKDGREKSLTQYLSSAFPFIGIDEAGQFSFWVWEFLQHRNRVNPGCAQSASGKFPSPCMALATNPLGIGWPWIKRIFCDHEPPPEAADMPLSPEEYFFVHSTILDNEALMERDPGYIEKLRKLPPDKRKKFLEGDINLVSGQYYGNFSTAKHVVDLDADPGRIEWQNWQPTWISLDWGIAHYAVAHWFTRALVRREDGTRGDAVVCYRELIVKETSIQRFGQIMGEMCDGRYHGGDPAAERQSVANVFCSHELFNRRSDPSPDQTVAAELGRVLRRHKLPQPRRAAGSASASERRTGAMMIYEDLDQASLVFVVNSSGSGVPRTAAAVPMLARSESDIDDVEKTSTMEDDIFDSLKHGVLSVRRGRDAPVADQVRVQAAGIADPLNRWFFLREMQKKRQDKMQPFSTPDTPPWMSRT